MVADKLFEDHLLRIAHNTEGLRLCLLQVEWWVWFNGTLVLALSTLVGVSLLDNFLVCFLGFLFSVGLLDFGLVKEEAL